MRSVVASAALLCGIASIQAADIARLETAVVATEASKYYGTYSSDSNAPSQWGGNLPPEDASLRATLLVLNQMKNMSNTFAFGCTEDALRQNAELQEQIVSE
jgi:hypothetical protein